MDAPVIDDSACVAFCPFLPLDADGVAPGLGENQHVEFVRVRLVQLKLHHRILRNSAKLFANQIKKRRLK